METKESVEQMFNTWFDRATQAKHHWTRMEDLYTQGRALEVDVERTFGFYLQCRSVADMLAWVIQKEVQMP